METFKAGMEKYVDFLGTFSDPLHVGMKVHLTLFLVNFVVIYIILRWFSRNSNSKFWRVAHEMAGFVSLVLAYLLSAVFIWVKNN